MDGLAEQILGNVQGLELGVTIDHARLAAAEGVIMPPSLLTIYSDHASNSVLIREDPLVALELPHRVVLLPRRRVVSSFGDRCRG